MNPVNVSADDRLLTAKDLRNIIGCSKDRAYELIHSESFPCIKIGSRYYVKKSAVDLWLETYSGREYLI